MSSCDYPGMRPTYWVTPINVYHNLLMAFDSHWEVSASSREHYFWEVVSLAIRAGSALNEAKAELKKRPKKRRTEDKGEVSEWGLGFYQSNHWGPYGKVNSVPTRHTPQYCSSAFGEPAGGHGVPSCTHCWKRHHGQCFSRGDLVCYSCGQSGHIKRQCPMTTGSAPDHSAQVGSSAPSVNQWSVYRGGASTGTGRGCGNRSTARVMLSSNRRLKPVKRKLQIIYHLLLWILEWTLFLLRIVTPGIQGWIPFKGVRMYKNNNN